MRPIAEGLFTDEPQPRLIGGRHRESGRIVFPCPPSADYDPFPLRRDGTLWSYTIQRYRPKSPPYAGQEAFRPWALGYVALEGEVMVEARLDGLEPEAIRIGMPMTMVPGALERDGDETVAIPAFRPTGASA